MTHRHYLKIFPMAVIPLSKWNYTQLPLRNLRWTVWNTLTIAKLALPVILVLRELRRCDYCLPPRLIKFTRVSPGICCVSSCQLMLSHPWQYLYQCSKCHINCTLYLIASSGTERRHQLTRHNLPLYIKREFAEPASINLFWPFALLWCEMTKKSTAISMA